jgi:hypothetical protein
MMARRSIQEGSLEEQNPVGIAESVVAGGLSDDGVLDPAIASLLLKAQPLLRK